MDQSMTDMTTLHLVVTLDVEKNEGVSLTESDLQHITDHVKRVLQNGEDMGSLSPDDFDGGVRVLRVARSGQ